VVRILKYEYNWSMIGLITRIYQPQYGDRIHYSIRWIDPSMPNSDRWQAHEFELVEIANKMKLFT